MAEAFQPVKFSPLSGLASPAGGIALVDRAYIGKINVRGNADNAEFQAGIKRCLHLELPLAPNTTSSNAQHILFWLGPNEWLLHCPEDTQAEVESTLRQEVSGLHAAVTDVTDYYAVIRLSGAKAREVLAKGTPFDVHPKIFTRGECAQTCFAHASILLHCVDDSPIFDLQVRWSFAEYLWQYLLDAAREYAS